MRPFVEDWDEVARSLIQRVRTEATGRVIDDKTRELLAALLAYPDVRTGSRPGGDRTRKNHPESRDEGRRATGAAPILPMIPISFRKSETVLNYFSLVTTVGTPQTVAAQDKRVQGRTGLLTAEMRSFRNV